MLRVLTFLAYRWPGSRALARWHEARAARRLGAGHAPRRPQPEPGWRLSAPRRPRGSRLR
jgi:hypothetical protein